MLSLMGDHFFVGIKSLVGDKKREIKKNDQKQEYPQKIYNVRKL
jgi:hypothetical protein